MSLYNFHYSYRSVNRFSRGEKLATNSKIWRALRDDSRTLVVSQDPLWSAEILSEGLFAT